MSVKRSLPGSGQPVITGQAAGSDPSSRQRTITQGEQTVFVSAVERIDEWLWRESGSPAERTLRGVLRYLRVVAADLGNPDITLRAMGLVYISLLSMVPMLALAFSLLKAMGVHNRMESVLLQALAPLGEGSVELSQRIIGFVENVKVGVLGGIGICLLIYAAINLIQKVENGLNYIWKVNRPRSLARRFSEYLSVLLVGPLIVSSALAFTASAMSSDYAMAILAVEPFGSLLLLFSRLLPFLLICGGFAFLYVFIPNTRVRALPAAAGGLFAGSMWQLASWGFAEFVQTSSNYDAVYSGFAVVIFLLIWLYVTWLILLLGGRVSFLVQHPEYLLPARTNRNIGGLRREGLALSIMLLVTDAFLRRRNNWREDAIARHLRMPPEETYGIIDRLRNGDLLVESSDDVPRLMPARDPGSITVNEVIQLVRAETGNQLATQRDPAPEGRIGQVMQAIEDSRAEVLGGMSLRDLVLGDREEPAS